MMAASIRDGAHPMKRLQVAETGSEDSVFHLEPIARDHCAAIIDIFNYYVENSFATYTATRVPYNFFDTFLKTARGVAALNGDGEVVGFAMLGVSSNTPAFSHTAEITYFIKPEYTGRGIGSSMLEYLICEAKKNSITSILASVSSRNRGSIAFHLKNGFRQAGKFLNVGRKNGELFDVIWMQKQI